MNFIDKERGEKGQQMYTQDFRLEEQGKWGYIYKISKCQCLKI